MPSLVEIDQMVLEKKIKMLKVYNNNNDANYDDDGDDNVDGQRTYFDQKSSLEPSAQVSYNNGFKD